MTPVFPSFLNDFLLSWTLLYVIDTYSINHTFVIWTTVFSFCLQVKYSKVFLRDTTLISPLSMLLFGGDIDVHHRERLISLDGWINFQVREMFCMRVLYQWLSMLGCLPALHWSRHWQEHWGIRNWFVKLWDDCYLSLLCFNSCQAPVRIGVIFKHLRKLMDSLLERKLANPRMNLEGNFNLTSNWLLNESSLYL